MSIDFEKDEILLARMGEFRSQRVDRVAKDVRKLDRTFSFGFERKQN